MQFSQLGLNANLQKAIKEQGYTTPTPIQKEAIPKILERKDILAAAQTGTGKTAAFTLPLLEIISKSSPKHKGKAYIKALILTPTRELAAQVAENITLYSKYLPLKTAVIFGGVGINPQKAQLRKGVDIVIATPGRLLDHINQKTIDLKKVEFLVLDEADRMLDMGFIHDIKKVIAHLPQHKQTLLFSATFSKEITHLSHTLLTNEETIEVAKQNSSSAQVSQLVYPVNKDKKRALLAHLISKGDWYQVLVFTRTKHGANKLCEFLNKEGIIASAIHGNKSQGARTKALADFKDNKVRVLVATDIAARGIDISLLPYVINFELPNVPEDYVHRIGRTGRAGNVGDAISLVCNEELDYLKAIEKLISKKITVEQVPGLTSNGLKQAKQNKKTADKKNKTAQERSKITEKQQKANKRKKEALKKRNEQKGSTSKAQQKKSFQEDVEAFLESRKKGKYAKNRRVTSDSKKYK